MAQINRTILYLLVLFLTGCGLIQSGAAGRDNLANRGPVIVSRSNPYLASNMLLAKEQELNPTLSGFLKIKGQPQALEVVKKILRPYLIYFYYPSLGQRYILEESEGDWVIRGPEILHKEELSKLPLEALSVSEIKEPIIDSELVTQTSEQVADFKDQPHTAKSLPDTTDDIDSDIVHIVKYKGETLRLIAGWYTGDPNNASRIARINGFKDANAIILDQKIRIPRYLLTKDTELTKEDVEFYLKR